MGPDDEQLLEQLGLTPGTTVAGKYRIESLIASGGMGAVLRAHHEVLDQTVAIKVMRPELVSEREAAQRFLREARAAAKISSDYVCRVTDVDLLEDSTPYMVMEHLVGRDLDATVECPDEIVVSDAVDYTMQALAGLEAAHAIGIVHRDLKPSNLFLVDRPDGTQRIKVLDFGISKVMEGETGGLKAGATTSTHAVLGTPRYMSPEQISSAKDVDERTDLWAAGLILYELLTKHYPFEGDNAGALLASVLTSEPPPLRSLRRDIPPELHAAVHRCLAKNRAHRFKSARSLLKALGPFASRRIQALLLSPEELAPAISPTASLGTPSAAIAELQASVIAQDEAPTLEASVAAAMGELNMSEAELDELAERAAAREREASANTKATVVSGAPGEQSPGRMSSGSDTAVATPMQGVGSASGKGMLIGVAALIAIGIFGGGVWMMSQGSDSLSPKTNTNAHKSADTEPPLGAAADPAPPSPEPTSAPPREPTAEPSAENVAPTQPEPAPSPVAPSPAAPSPAAPRPEPKAPPVVAKPKPRNLDSLLGERD